MIRTPITCPRCGLPTTESRSPDGTVTRVAPHACPHGIRQCGSCLTCWQLEAARHAAELVDVDDLLAPGDPYSVEAAMADAFVKRREPRAFVLEVFAADLSPDR
jgi:hypothetical protein